MSYKKDKISDVLTVLDAMRKILNGAVIFRDTTELRKEAVKDVAETEFRAGRYKNQESALKTIHDACARRLRPDLGKIVVFDRFADDWLHQNSLGMRDILLKHSKNYYQKAMVNDFFSEKA